EGAAEEPLAAGGGGRGGVDGAGIEELHEPGGRVRDGEIVEGAAEFEGVGAAGAVSGGGGDDVAAIGFEIDAAAEAVAGGAGVGGVGGGGGGEGGGAPPPPAGGGGGRGRAGGPSGAAGGGGGGGGRGRGGRGRGGPGGRGGGAGGRSDHQRVTVAGSVVASLTPFGVRGCLPGEPQWPAASREGWVRGHAQSLESGVTSQQGKTAHWWER